MRYRGGGIGHKVTRANNEGLLREELEVSEEVAEPSVGPIKVDGGQREDDEWESEDEDEPTEETYGHGIDEDSEDDDGGDGGGEDDDDENGLGPEDGEGEVGDIEGEEGYAPL